jgi:hypothetical protein
MNLSGHTSATTLLIPDGPTLRYRKGNSAGVFHRFDASIQSATWQGADVIVVLVGGKSFRCSKNSISKL